MKTVAGRGVTWSGAGGGGEFGVDAMWSLYVCLALGGDLA
jgi:hypothetical protein